MVVVAADKLISREGFGAIAALRLPVSLGFAFACFVFALLELVAWHLGWWTLVQLPGFQQGMHYITALCFLLLSSGVVACQAGFHRTATGLAVLVCLICGLRLVNDAVFDAVIYHFLAPDVVAGIDRLQIDFSQLSATGKLCFAILLIALQYKRISPSLLTVLALAALVPLVVGVIGYLTGVESYYSVYRGNAMSLNTAFAHLLLSGAFIAILRSRVSLVDSLHLVAFFAGSCLTFSLWQAAVVARSETAYQIATVQSEQFVVELKEELRQLARTMSKLSPATMAPETWTRTRTKILDTYRALVELQISTSIIADQPQWLGGYRVDDRRVIVAPTLDETTVLAAVDISRLIMSVMRPRLLELNVVLTDESGRELFRHGDTSDGEWQTTQVAIFDEPWKLQSTLTDAQRELLADFSQPRVAAVSGSLATILFTALVMALRYQLKRSRKMESLLTDRQHELELYTARLERSNEELDQFAYVASHDLKSPLRAVENLSTWLYEDYGELLPEAARDDLKLLRRRVKKMEGLLDSLLTYSRVGRSKDDVIELNLNEVVADLIAIQDVPEGVSVSIASELPTIRAAPGAINLIFGNLIGNAIKHGCIHGGNVEIRGREDAGFWEFEVADSGPGIPEDTRDRAFQMFQKLGGAAEGMGLGLALVKKTAEYLGGNVRIDMSALGGAAMVVQLPKESDSTSVQMRP